MIGITEEVMAEGMCADYDEVFSLTNQVYDLVRNAKTIHVTSAKGSDVTATFHKDWKWIPCHGRYVEQGEWGNLPEGEVFTAPASVDGVLVCEVLGDFFSEKYGVLERPIVKSPARMKRWQRRSVTTCSLLLTAIAQVNLLSARSPA